MSSCSSFSIKPVCTLVQHFNHSSFKRSVPWTDTFAKLILPYTARQACKLQNKNLLPRLSLLIPIASQDQGPELKAFSANLSNGTLDKPEPSDEASSIQKHQSSTSHKSLHSQNSALSWSQRQQLRRTSAAMRHASASRQLPHQDNRVPPGRPLASLLALVNSSIMVLVMITTTTTITVTVPVPITVTVTVTVTVPITVTVTVPITVSVTVTVTVTVPITVTVLSN